MVSRDLTEDRRDPQPVSEDRHDPVPSAGPFWSANRVRDRKSVV